MDSNDKFRRFSAIAAAFAAAAAIGTWLAVGFLAVWFLWPRDAQGAEFSVTRDYVLPMFQRTSEGIMTGGASLVVIRPGYALTNYHAVRQAELPGMNTIEVVTGMGTFPLVIAATGPGFDLALVHSPALMCPCATLGNDPARDETVIAVGFPRVRQIQTQWLTAGLIQRSDGIIIQHSAWMTTGNSGGGLFAYQQGQWVLVGLNRAIVKIDRQELNNVGYAVPVSVLRGFLEAVKDLTQ
jgi:S1-C subfamily serine protease